MVCCIWFSFFSSFFRSASVGSPVCCNSCCNRSCSALSCASRSLFLSIAADCFVYPSIFDCRELTFFKLSRNWLLVLIALLNVLLKLPPSDAFSLKSSSNSFCDPAKLFHLPTHYCCSVSALPLLLFPLHLWFQSMQKVCV